MKHINKSIGHEPEALRAYRTSTPDATYSGFTDTGQSLKRALVDEQGGLCAYCMRRISLKRNKSLGKPRVEVEHYLSRDGHPQRQLDYMNMLGVCNGDLGGSSHCDKSKAEGELHILNPLEERCEELVKCSLGGEIEAIGNHEFIEGDIKLLNLNNQNLIEARRAVIDIALNRLINKRSSSTWTKALIQKEIEFWSQRDKRNRLHPYCQVAVWFWKKKQQSGRYPAK